MGNILLLLSFKKTSVLSTKCISKSLKTGLFFYLFFWHCEKFKFWRHIYRTAMRSSLCHGLVFLFHYELVKDNYLHISDMIINTLQINMLKTDKYLLYLLYNTKLLLELVLHYCNINFDLYRAWILGFNVFIFLILLLVHDYLGFEPTLVSTQQIWRANLKPPPKQLCSLSGNYTNHHWEQRQKLFDVTFIPPLTFFELITTVNDTHIHLYPQWESLKLNTIVLPWSEVDCLCIPRDILWRMTFVCETLSTEKLL